MVSGGSGKSVMFKEYFSGFRFAAGEICGSYHSNTALSIHKELDVVKEFMELIKIVDCD